MIKKKDIPKTQLRRNFARCKKCNSPQTCFNGQIVKGKFQRICIDCGNIFDWSLNVITARKLSKEIELN